MLRTYVTAVALTALTALSFSTSSAARNIPAHGNRHGDKVCMGEPFHFTGYDYRIMTIRWVSADDRFATTIAPYAKPSTAPNGYLVFKVPVKNMQNGEATAPGLDITAYYRDGTFATSNETPFSSSGAPQTATNFLPDQGMTMYYAIANVPQPTKSNPVVKLILRYAANNDPGYPDTYYMKYPIFTR